MPTTIGVIREEAPGERRVALVPDVAAKLAATGLELLVEAGAGEAAWFNDSAYTEAGATVVSAATLAERADVLLCVRPPGPERIAGLRTGQTLVGMLDPLGDPGLAEICASRGVTAVSLDLLPRTLSRAQAMDALTSQANIAGYKAVIVAADAYGRFFPMLMTAAGTVRPAQVLVLGAGVAGLAAIGTARRLGAQVTAYDIRPQTCEEVRSLGARFLDLAGVTEGQGTGGYARVLTDEERLAQQEALQQRIAEFDVVITTAQVPGRRPPLLVTAKALKGMRSGSVVVDLAAGPLGGNVEGSQAGERVVTEESVTLIGAGDLPSEMAPAASAAYAHNIAATLAHLIHDGVPAVDLSDEIQAAIVLTHDGAVVNPSLLPTGGIR